MKYFVYCRKSSEGEERQALSIPAQIDEIKRIFGDVPEIEIVEWLEEKMSAKAPGRPVYSRMIKRIENGEADGIVAWHPDRLARNSVDGGWIIHLLDRGVLKDLKFVSYTYENSPQGLFMLQIMFGQSKYYVDNLSVNVKRGRRKKIALGWHPGRPPIGYRNDKTTSTIISDPDRFELIQRMWRMLLSGAYSPNQIRSIATDQWGLRLPLGKKTGGGPIALSTVYRIFSNPFYAGVLVANDEWHPGKHLPMVSLEEFNRAQALIGAPGYAKPKKHEFAFTGGLIRCQCGLSVTAELKTKPSGRTYVYYHCTRRLTPRCNQRAVRVETIDEALSRHLREISLPPRLEAWLISKMARSERDISAEQKMFAQAASKALAATESELRILIEMRTRDLIDDSEFVGKRREMQAEVLRLRGAVEARNMDADKLRLELADCVILFRKYSADWLSDASAAEKRLILQTVGSNSVLTDGKLSIQAGFPFEVVDDDPKFLVWSAQVEHIGTDPAQKDRVERLISAVRYLEACSKARHQGTAPPPAPSQANPRRSRTASAHDVRQRALRLAEGQSLAPQERSV
jgi:DNA invertase Pin-like site-specific DNA recombinase